MSEMIERVAKVLVEGMLKGSPAPPWSEWKPIEKQWWLAHARVVIEAMREPSSEMSEQPEYGDNHKGPRVHPSCSVCGGGVYQWRAMIDAALGKTD